MKFEQIELVKEKLKKFIKTKNSLNLLNNINLNTNKINFIFYIWKFKLNF
jgi:hypothetical protein